MVKQIYFILLIFFLIPIVYGGVTVEYSIDNSTWTNVTDVEEDTGEAYQDNLEEGTLYYFRAKNDTTDWVYFTQRTDTSGEKGMSSLAVTGFVLIITIGLFLLPFLIRRFSQHEILDTTLKGLCIILALFLLSLDTAMVATLSDTFSLGVTTEIFRFLWLINWTTYIAIVIVVLTFGWKTLNLWKLRKHNKSMGYDGEEN